MERNAQYNRILLETLNPTITHDLVIWVWTIMCIHRDKQNSMTMKHDKGTTISVTLKKIKSLQFQLHDVSYFNKHTNKSIH